MKISFSPNPDLTPARTVRAHLVFRGEDPAAFAGLGPESAELVRRGLSCSRFDGSAGDILDIVAPATAGPDRLLFVGAGDRSQDGLTFERAGGHALKAAEAVGATRLEVAGGDLTPAAAAAVAFGARLAAYRFVRRQGAPPAKQRPTVCCVQVLTPDEAAATAAWTPLAALAEAVTFARDQVSEPGNVLSPEVFAQRLQSLGGLGLDVEVLGEAELARLGLGALLAVGQGSPRESQLVTLRWNGGRPGDPPLAFVGKGVCFDSGGLSIKPCDHMADMKWDMAGAAAVAGCLHALAGRRARVNAVGVVGLVENMPDGAAQRPGDVLTSLSGKTIEVIDTDAEGRLVLADLLWHTQEQFAPRLIVDLATLTGAVSIALGSAYGGLFANDEALAAALLAAGEAAGEPLWRLPLADDLRKQIESPIADLKNYGAREGGAISAALFLREFIRDTPWAHIDMAGMAWRTESPAPTTPDGATGYGVRLLDRYVADNHG